jgi:hypothetical protein
MHGGTAILFTRLANKFFIRLIQKDGLSLQGQQANLQHLVPNLGSRVAKARS